MPQENSIKIGKKGIFKFSKGYYVYTGSAKNGLKSRIQRHFNRTKKKFWHIILIKLKNLILISLVLISLMII